MKDQIIHYLASGIKPAQVATIVGCTPAYIAQLLKDESFKEKLVAATVDVSINTVETKLEAKYESMEHSILAQMQETLLSAELPALTKALHTVAVVQDLKARRKNPVLLAPSSSTTINYVTVAMPAQFIAAKPVIEMNSNKEILSINNQLLAPMSNDGVKNLFEAIKQRRDQNEFHSSATEAGIERTIESAIS